ncbi:hypothetical protein [Enterococcus larvae]|uniref:hypothetical protein n=1 Tax=Enterococcus larvae TaxID=2794352 RepID=UPI003F387C1E
MKTVQQEELLSLVEHQIGMIKTYYSKVEGANDLLEIYQDYQNEGTSITEMRAFKDDLDLFIEGQKEGGC